MKSICRVNSQPNVVHKIRLTNGCQGFVHVWETRAGAGRLRQGRAHSLPGPPPSVSRPPAMPPPAPKPACAPSLSDCANNAARSRRQRRSLGFRGAIGDTVHTWGQAACRRKGRTTGRDDGWRKGDTGSVAGTAADPHRKEMAPVPVLVPAALVTGERKGMS